MTKPVYALAINELDKELESIKACHAILQKHDNNSRDRIITWLSRWAHDESGRGF